VSAQGTGVVFTIKTLSETSQTYVEIGVRSGFLKATDSDGNVFEAELGINTTMTPTQGSSGGSSNAVSGGAIAGIVIGIIVLIVIIAILLVFALKKEGATYVVDEEKNPDEFVIDDVDTQFNRGTQGTYKRTDEPAPPMASFSAQ
jgi:hypothetical protein